jgi:predicted RNA-binding Zn-ribbon protein involved in translation (DUF1610 family)
MSRITINGKPLICPHCGGAELNQRAAQLNTAGLAFFNLEWMNKSAAVFHCQACGRLEWFLDPDVSESESDPSSEVSGTPWENNPDHTNR